MPNATQQLAALLTLPSLALFWLWRPSWISDTKTWYFTLHFFPTTRETYQKPRPQCWHTEVASPTCKSSAGVPKSEEAQDLEALLKQTEIKTPHYTAAERKLIWSRLQSAVSKTESMHTVVIDRKNLIHSNKIWYIQTKFMIAMLAQQILQLKWTFFTGGFKYEVLTVPVPCFPTRQKDLTSRTSCQIFFSLTNFTTL